MSKIEIFHSANFFRSYAQGKDLPSVLPEIAFLGRSNSGKSTLINTIVGQNQLVKTSKTPGKTKLINYFGVGELFYLVDLPGFGYSKVSHKDHKIMMELLGEYLNYSQKLKILLILVDCKREIPEEEGNYIIAACEKGIQPILVRTKTDKLNQSEKSKLHKSMQEWKKNYKGLEIFLTTNKNDGEMQKLKKFVLSTLNL
jgi:GTP-binding protein